MFRVRLFVGEGIGETLTGGGGACTLFTDFLGSVEFLMGLVENDHTQKKSKLINIIKTLLQVHRFSKFAHTGKHHSSDSSQCMICIKGKKAQYSSKMH